MTLGNKLLGLIRRVGESKAWVCKVMRVTMDDSWAEHSLATLDDDIHVRNIWNLAGRGRSSVSRSRGMSTGDRSHESHG